MLAQGVARIFPFPGAMTNSSKDMEKILEPSIAPRTKNLS